MDSAGATNVFKSIEVLLKEVKQEIDKSRAQLKQHNFAALEDRIASLEYCYKQLLNQAQSRDSIIELVELKELLEDTNAKLDDQIQNTTDLIWSVDKKIQIRTINNNFATNFKIAFGVKLKEGVNVLSCLPEPLRSIWKERYDRALKGEQFSIIDQFDFEDIPQYSETSFNPIKNGNEIVGVACFSRDITKQKSSEEQFKLLARLSPNPISIMSVDGYMYVNEAWEQIFEYTADEALASDISLILPNGKNDRLKKQIDDFITDGTDHRNTYQVRTKSNKLKWIDVSTTHLKFNNEVAILSVTTDVTELLHLQEELKIGKANLTALINNTEARIWSIDKHINIVSLNNNFKNDFKIAFGIELDQGVSAINNVPEPLHTLWTDRYNRALKGERYTFVEEFEIEKIPQFVEVSFSPIELEGEIVGVSCYSRDISVQKRAEIALKDSEQRFKTLVDNLPSTTYRCNLDKDWTMEFISDEINELTGYNAEEFTSGKRTFASIIHSEDRNKVYKDIETAVKKKESYRVEYRITHRTGTLKWVHERGRAHFSKAGKVLWLDGVISDITSRRQSEEILRESEEQYRAIFNSMSDVFIRTDLKGTILIVTPSIIDLLGYTPEEIIGRSINDLYKISSERRKLLAVLSEKGYVRDFEAEFPTQDGDDKYISINAKLIVNEEGEPYAIEAMARDITLRKVAQKALEERTQELDSIFENTPIILLLVDKNGRVLNINKAGSSDYSEEKSHFTKLLAGEAIKCVNTFRKNHECGEGEPCQSCVIQNVLRETFETRRNQNQIEGSININIDGQIIERRFLISTTYIEFEEDIRVLISLDDITEIREAEEEIRRLSAAVDQSTATIVITDINGRIEYVNPQFEKSTGYSAIEVMGRNPRVLKTDKTPLEHYEQMWSTILDGKTWTGEFLNKRKDGSEYWESANISPITNREGTITHFIAIKEDVTEKKRIQEELVRSEKELREMNSEKSRYLSILAHDLRGLVGSFHAYSDLILSHYEEFSDDERKEQLLNLSNVSRDSLGLLDNLLAWGKATQGRIKLDITPINLYENTATVVNTVKELAISKQVELINAVDKSITINSDINVFQTIIRNLINNSIKFTPSGGSIKISTSRLSNKLIEVSVTDTGIGMPKDVSDILFKMGEKVVREGTNQESGTGLGLIICKEMVTKLGGSIHVESEVGKGSRFYFRLPVK